MSWNSEGREKEGKEDDGRTAWKPSNFHGDEVRSGMTGEDVLLS